MELMEDQRCSSSYSQPQPCVEVSSQLHDLAALPTETELPVPTEQEIRWVPEPVWRV